MALSSVSTVLELHTLRDIFCVKFLQDVSFLFHRIRSFSLQLQVFAEHYIEMAHPYLDVAQEYANVARVHVNKSCQGLEAWQIITLTFGITLLLTWIYDLLFQQDECKCLAVAKWLKRKLFVEQRLRTVHLFCFISALSNRAKKSFFRFVRSLPFVKGRIEKEIEGTVTSLQKSFNKGLDNFSYYQALPREGLSEVNYLSTF